MTTKSVTGTIVAITKRPVKTRFGDKEISEIKVDAADYKISTFKPGDVKEGDKVTIAFNEEVNGKYTNRNATAIVLLEPGTVVNVPVQIAQQAQMQTTMAQHIVVEKAELNDAMVGLLYKEAKRSHAMRGIESNIDSLVADMFIGYNTIQRFKREAKE